MDSSSHRIGIVVAMQSELVHLLNAFPSAELSFGSPFAAFHLDTPRGIARATRAGIGLVDAAAATQWLIGDFHPDIVLNFGCAGAHENEMLPGDVVVANRFVNPAAGQMLADGSFRHRGFVFEEDQGSDWKTFLSADFQLQNELAEVARNLQFESWPIGDKIVRAPQVYVGGVASADIWTQSVSRIREIATEHYSLCEDMEAIAIARICDLHHLPFGSVKDISNNELTNASDLDEFSDFPTREVGKRSAQVISAWLRRPAR